MFKISLFNCKCKNVPYEVVNCLILLLRSAPWHKTKAVTKWYQAKDINELYWPENSIDFNPRKIIDLIKHKYFN